MQQTEIDLIKANRLFTLDTQDLIYKGKLALHIGRKVALC